MSENFQKVSSLRKLVQSTIVGSVMSNNVDIVDDKVPKHHNQINSKIVRICSFVFGRPNGSVKERRMCSFECFIDSGILLMHLNHCINFDGIILKYFLSCTIQEWKRRSDKRDFHFSEPNFDCKQIQMIICHRSIFCKIHNYFKECFHSFDFRFIKTCITAAISCQTETKYYSTINRVDYFS